MEAGQAGSESAQPEISCIILPDAADVRIGYAVFVARPGPEMLVLLSVETAKSGPGSQPKKAGLILMNGPHKGSREPGWIVATENPIEIAICCLNRQAQEMDKKV